MKIRNGGWHIFGRITFFSSISSELHSKDPECHVQHGKFSIPTECAFDKEKKTILTPSYAELLLSEKNLPRGCFPDRYKFGHLKSMVN